MTRALRPAPLGNVNDRLLSLRAAVLIFGALPFASMVQTLQSRELRKYSLVCCIDLSFT